MSSKVEIICACGCGRKKMVKKADVKRGWGKFFDKSCKARVQSKKKGGRSQMSKAKRHQCLVDARNDGRISDEYYLMVIESEYPEFMTNDELNDIAINDCHPFSDEALGQW